MTGIFNGLKGKSKRFAIRAYLNPAFRKAVELNVDKKLDIYDISELREETDKIINNTYENHKDFIEGNDDGIEPQSHFIASFCLYNSLVNEDYPKDSFLNMIVLNAMLILGYEYENNIVELRELNSKDLEIYSKCVNYMKDREVSSSEKEIYECLTTKTVNDDFDKKESEMNSEYEDDDTCCFQKLYGYSDSEEFRTENKEPIQNEDILEPEEKENIKILSEDDIYEKALREIEDNTVVKSLWAKSLVKSDGEKSKAEALYIKERVNNLLAEQNRQEEFAENKRQEQEYSKSSNITQIEKLVKENKKIEEEFEDYRECWNYDSNDFTNNLINIEKDNKTKKINNERKSFYKQKFTRKKFWIWSFLLIILDIVCSTLLSRDIAISYIVTFTIGITWLFVLANRIRDYGSNPWISLLALIPLVNLVLALYYGIEEKKKYY